MADALTTVSLYGDSQRKRESLQDTFPDWNSTQHSGEAKAAAGEFSGKQPEQQIEEMKTEKTIMLADAGIRRNQCRMPGFICR